MRILDHGSSGSDDEVVIALTGDEAAFLANAINEAREAIADWEFPIRLGFTLDEADALWTQLSALADESAPPE